MDNDKSKKILLKITNVPIPEVLVVVFKYVQGINLA